MSAIVIGAVWEYVSVDLVEGCGVSIPTNGFSSARSKAHKDAAGKEPAVRVFEAEPNGCDLLIIRLLSASRDGCVDIQSISDSSRHTSAADRTCLR